MSSELWRLQRLIRRILGRPGLRICSETETGLSLEQSGAWACHTPGRIILADEVAAEPVLAAAVVAHEAAHALLSPESLSPEASDLDGLRSLLSVPWQTWPAHRGAAWAGHDWKWIRAVCHVAHRMRGHGLWVATELVADLRLYGLQGSLSEYADALGDEPSRSDWLPVTEVLARPCPAEFESLWTADVRRSLGVGSIDKGKSDVDVTVGASSKSGGGSRRRRT